VVTRPHANDGTACNTLAPATASCEGFTLPTLPSSFPNSTAGAQQQAGFEARIGSGNACTGSCPGANEMCVIPAGTSLPTQCMGKDSASGTYYTETYTWVLEDRILNNAPTAVTAGSADFTQNKPGLTQVSSNVASW
jgi:hypothetical protein